jgi:hypothetical protein
MMIEFKCKGCGCRRFWRHSTKELLVDFGREGAIAGHPALEGSEKSYLPTQFQCAECGLLVDSETAKQMEAEVI